MKRGNNLQREQDRYNFEKRHRVVFFALFGFLTIVLFLQCNQTIEMGSVWMKGKVAIDGDVSEWKSVLRTTDDKFGIGVGNDDSALYICLISEDREIVHQVMRCGLTVWFETGKSEKNRLGIRFPLGRTGARDRRPQEGLRDSAAILRMREEAFTGLEVLGPGKHDTIPMKVSIAESWGGLKLKATSDMEEFRYELKIPLHPDSATKFAAVASRDSLITVVVESSAPEQSAPSAGEHGAGGHEYAGGGGGGHKGGGGHGRSGGGGGGFSGGHFTPSEPFSTALLVKLAGAGN
jgi:hypothetical protein